MGGPAGSGGSDNSDERKVDTYSQQYQTLKQKKNKTGRYENHNKIPSIAGAVTTALKDPIDRYNLNRRMKFANKEGVNINLQGLSTDQILSKDFKAQLDAKGYTRKTQSSASEDDSRNSNAPRPTILKKNVGGQTVQTTEAKVAEEKKEATQYDERQTKKKGRRKNTLTSSQGVMKASADYSLGKKSLLGQVV